MSKIVTPTIEAAFRSLTRPVLELLKSGTKAAGEIASGVSVSKPTLSGHFAKLKEADLIRAEQDGTTIYYTLNVSVLEEAVLKFMETMNITEAMNITEESKK